MAPIPSTFSLISLFFIISIISCHSTNTSYLKTICNITPHCQLCEKTLKPFLDSLSPHSPSEWARFAVSISIKETEHMQKRLMTKTHHRLPAFIDCVECMRDATVQLHSSMNELKSLDGNKSKFVLQMNDIETWVSAAMTDAYTCLDGLEGFKEREVGDVKRKVLKVSYLCGNALALVNELASDGDIG